MVGDLRFSCWRHRGEAASTHFHLDRSPRVLAPSRGLGPAATSALAASTTARVVLVDLRIAGCAVTARPAPGTTLSVTGVATVVLNQQRAGTSAGRRTKCVITVGHAGAGVAHR